VSWLCIDKRIDKNKERDCFYFYNSMKYYDDENAFGMFYYFRLVELSSPFITVAPPSSTSTLERSDSSS